MTGDPLDQPVTSKTFCWQMERRDGAGIALTSGDHPLNREGIVYHPDAGPSPAAVNKGGIGEMPGELEGTLSSAALSEEDLLGGRWDGARVILDEVDWTDPAGGTVRLITGELGELTVESFSVRADLVGASAKLKAPVCPHTSPECRAELGDRKCRVDLAGRSVRLTVIEAKGDGLVVKDVVDQRFDQGLARWIRGNNTGLKTRVLHAEGQKISLQDMPHNTIRPGDVLLVTEGCDRRLATCIERFRNAENFRAEPYLPGNDLLTRYPGN